MNANELPNSQDIEQLLARYETAASAEIIWEGAHPNYPESVSALMHYITTSAWCHPNYPAGKMQAMFERLDAASLIDVKSMLTAIARGERFCTGHWQLSIESGQLRAVIDRAIHLLNSA